MSDKRSASDRGALREFLDYQREALIGKVEGLSEAQSRSAPTVSSLSLLSILKHSATWEKRWFQVIVAGRTFPGEWPEVRPQAPDATFRLEDHETVESVVADYRSQIAVSNEILASFDLDGPCALRGVRSDGRDPHNECLIQDEHAARRLFTYLFELDRAHA